MIGGKVPEQNKTITSRVLGVDELVTSSSLSPSCLMTHLRNLTNALCFHDFSAVLANLMRSPFLCSGSN